jgi:hypothetical protein
METRHVIRSISMIGCKAIDGSAIHDSERPPPRQDTSVTGDCNEPNSFMPGELSNQQDEEVRSLLRDVMGFDRTNLSRRDS